MVSYFEQIDEEMYHVTKDCYYGLQTGKYEFEIAWGVEWTIKSNRKFQIHIQ